MNSTNVLLGSTGFLLVVALLFSFTRMNNEKNKNPEEVAYLLREIELLQEEKAALENQKRKQSSDSLIWQQASYTSAPVAPEATTTSTDYSEIQEQIAALREDIANRAPAPTPDPAPTTILPDLTEPIIADPVIDEVVEETPHQKQRQKLIELAILQGTVQGWDPDWGTVIVDPAPRANFALGDTLALRRNNGILCSVQIESRADQQYVGTVVATLAGEMPQLTPGDELIIPPPFERITE